MIIEAEAAFWQRVVDGNPPDPTTYADAVQRFGQIKVEGAVVATNDIAGEVDRLRMLRSSMDELKAFEEEAKARIILTLGDAGDLLISPDGTPLVTYKLSNGRKTFDAKALEKEMPEIYQKYLRNGEPSRRFLLK